MKTLYLHIGCPKTATSAIQIMLRRNSDLLLKHGYAFPLHPYRYSSAAVRRNGHFLVMKEKMVSSEEKKAAWMQRLDTGLEMIHRAFDSSDNVILSDEGLWFGVNYDAESFLDFLPEDARQNGYILKIIVYLRRQDLFLSSLWNQKVKYKGYSKPLSQFISDRTANTPLYVDYDTTLRKIAGIIGMEHVIVRRFEETAWKQHSIYADFLDAIGLDPELPVTVPTKKVNASFNPNAIELQRSVNSAAFLTKDVRARLSSCIKTLPENEPGHCVYQHLSAEETVSFLAPYQEGNERIAKDFLCDGRPLFSEEPEKDTETNACSPSCSESMTPDTMQFFLAVTQDICHEMDGLSKQMNTLFMPVKRFRQLKNAIRHPQWALSKIAGKLR